MHFVVGMLRNVATNRFHPIVFRRAPLPGGADERLAAHRYKSQGHHTKGFDTLDEARAHVAGLDTSYDKRDLVWDWDGTLQDAVRVAFFEPLIVTP